MPNLKLPPLMARVDLSPQEIPDMLMRLDMLTRTAEYAEFRPYFYDFLKQAAQNFGVSEGVLLDILNTPPEHIHA